MTAQEILKLIFVVKAAYPRPFERYTKADYDNMQVAWGMALEDFSYAEASRGLKSFLKGDSKGFPPSPGQIVNEIQKMKFNPKTEMTAAEAWELVYKAICDLRWDEPEIEFNKLPKTCQRAIGSASALADIAQMDTNNVMIGEKARFIRQYDMIREHEKDFEKLPNRVKDLIDKRTFGALEEKK